MPFFYSLVTSRTGSSVRISPRKDLALPRCADQEGGGSVYTFRGTIPRRGIVLWFTTQQLCQRRQS